jgi:hypothetical protein
MIARRRRSTYSTSIKRHHLTRLLTSIPRKKAGVLDFTIHRFLDLLI